MAQKVKCWVCGNKDATRSDGMCKDCGEACAEETAKTQNDILEEKPVPDPKTPFTS